MPTVLDVIKSPSRQGVVKNYSPISNKDGSIILPPGAPVPNGYVAVGTSVNGGTIAVPAYSSANKSDASAQGSSGVGSALVSAGGLYGASKLHSALTSASAEPAMEISGAAAQPEGAAYIMSGPYSGTSATSGVSSVGNIGAGQTAIAYPVGTSIDGGTIMSDGSISPLSSDGSIAMNASATPLYEGGPSALGAVGAGASIIGGTYGTHKLYSQGEISPEKGALAGAASGAALGAGVGSFIPGVGTVIGAAVGGVIGATAGAAKGFLGHKLNKSEQIQRNIRTGLGPQGVGLFKYETPSGRVDTAHLQLADGSYFNIESKGKQSTSIDPNLKNGQQAILWADPISVVLNGGMGEGDGMGGGDVGEGQAALTGYLVNAAASNAASVEGIRANLLNVIAQLGMTDEGMIDALTKIKDAGKIDQGSYDIYVSNINSLFSGDQKSYTTMTPGDALDFLVSQGYVQLDPITGALLPSSPVGTAQPSTEQQQQPASSNQPMMPSATSTEQLPRTSSAILDKIREAQSLDARG